jgi:signal transduction histidine kinase
MRRFAGKVVEGVRAVDEIVKALLGFARPSAEPSRTATVRAVVDRAASAAGLPQARLLLSGSTQAIVDADALGRVLDNLIRNALEAAPATAIRMRAEHRDGMLELDVEDDGPGVAAAVARRVFEPFVSTKERGTGLGLPLSSRVLSYLGGGLELLNPGEPGARFRVRIPPVGPTNERERPAAEALL